jgi:hypothetical protein
MTRPNSGCDRYYAVENILSSRLLPKDALHYKFSVSVGVRNLVFHIQGVKTLGVLETKVLKRKFESNRKEITEGWRKL